MSKKLILIFFLVYTQHSKAIDESYDYGRYLEVDHILKSMPPSRPSGIPFNRAVLKYGRPVVQEGEFRIELEKKPWSSWWYPVFETRLFEDSPEGEKSTLKRYDLYRIKNNIYTGNSRKYEKENLFNLNATKWAGLCHAWAMASIMEDEPKNAVTKNGVHFRIRDLKALLIKTYERSFPRKDDIFGQRNNGRYGDVYEDIYPEQFHTILMEELFKNKRAFIMDYDAGYQVWNVPVYGARVRIKKHTDDPHVVHVNLLLKTASPFVDPDYVGTEHDNRLYYYDFYGNWEGEKFIVDYGIWIKGSASASRRAHPDFVAIKSQILKQNSANKFIDTNIVYEILEGSR
jgi:hypothetical protein